MLSIHDILNTHMNPCKTLRIKNNGHIQCQDVILVTSGW